MIALRLDDLFTINNVTILISNIFPSTKKTLISETVVLFENTESHSLRDLRGENMKTRKTSREKLLLTSCWQLPLLEQFGEVTRGKTLCQNNRQLIGMPLIGLARQAKNRSQLYFLLQSSLSIWAYGGVKDHIMEL